MDVKEVGDKGGVALVKFIETLPEEDIKLLSKIPSGLIAKIFQAGCVFAMDVAIENYEKSKATKDSGGKS